jgi:hypothetical protein
MVHPRCDQARVKNKTRDGTRLLILFPYRCETRLYAAVAQQALGGRDAVYGDSAGSADADTRATPAFIVDANLCRLPDYMLHQVEEHRHVCLRRNRYK